MPVQMPSYPPPLPRIAARVRLRRLIPSDLRVKYTRTVLRS